MYAIRNFQLINEFWGLRYSVQGILSHIFDQTQLTF